MVLVRKKRFTSENPPQKCIPPCCGDRLTALELDHVRDGAKIITLELAARFMTDCLSGDACFKICRENNKLDRCSAQIKMVQEMEDNWSAMKI
jgi:hypothetical protein